MIRGPPSSTRTDTLLPCRTLFVSADGATERIEPQGGMTAPESRAVIAALSAQGSEVRVVGGCVRDALAGRPVRDVDLAPPDRPEQVMALLQAAGLKAVPTGLDHGTVTALPGHRPFEIGRAHV